VKKLHHVRFRGGLWEAAFLSALSSVEFRHIKATYFASRTLEEELDRNMLSGVPNFGVNVLAMVVFACVSCGLAGGDWVRGKPLLGLVGVISAVMGTASAFGFASLVGLPFIGINMIIPFLMLGIGIDDTFVMLAAWRRSDRRQSTEERMSETYSSAAVSITITSLTDALSFFVGATTPFPGVQIFCTYSG